MPTKLEIDQFKQTIRDQALVNKMERLAKHLGISMSLMSDQKVETQIRRGGMPAPAATSEREYYVSDWAEKRGGRYVSGKRNGVAKRPPQRHGYTTVFDVSQLPGLDKLGVWLGIAWHELGHVLWSVFNSRITIGLNLLEDARIETLLIHKYPKTKGALLLALNHLLDMLMHPKNAQDPKYVYAWVAGRTHLPKAIRTELRATCEKYDPGVADKIDEIYREYLGMGSKFDRRTAYDLAGQLNKILGINQGEHNNVPTCEGAGSSFTDKSEAIARDGDLPQETLDDIGGDPNGSGGDPTDKEGDETSDSGESTGDDSDTTNEEGGGASTAQAHFDRVREAKANKEKLKEAIAKEAGQDENLSKEVAKLAKYLDAGYAPIAKGDAMVALTPTPKARRVAQKLKQTAARFNDDSGKGIIRNLDHGRIRPMRYERTGDIDTAYDAWEPGLSQEMYIVLLIDVSGSMRQAPISEIVYALEVGLGDVATVEPVLFNETFAVPGVSNSPTRMIKLDASGGTDPTDGLAYAHHKLLQRSAANKLLAMYSDGKFNSSGRNMTGQMIRRDTYMIVRSYMEDLMRQGVDVHVLDEKGQGKMSRLMLPKGHTHIVQGIQDLPKIVEAWTRNVLTTK